MSGGRRCQTGADARWNDGCVAWARRTSADDLRRWRLVETIFHFSVAERRRRRARYASTGGRTRDEREGEPGGAPWRCRRRDLFVEVSSTSSRGLLHVALGCALAADRRGSSCRSAHLPPSPARSGRRDGGSLQTSTHPACPASGVARQPAVTGDEDVARTLSPGQCRAPPRVTGTTAAPSVDASSGLASARADGSARHLRGGVISRRGVVMGAQHTRRMRRRSLGARSPALNRCATRRDRSRGGVRAPQATIDAERQWREMCLRRRTSPVDRFTKKMNATLSGQRAVGERVERTPPSVTVLPARSRSYRRWCRAGATPVGVSAGQSKCRPRRTAG